MPVNRPDVIEAKFFKQRGGHHHALGLLFKAFGEFQQRGCPLEHCFSHTPGGRIKAPAHQLGQVAVERANGRADAHVVVVQDDQQLAVGDTCVIERLERHAGRQRTVANDGHRVPVFTLDMGRQRHAQRRRDGRAGVRRAKGVVVTLGALRKAAQPAPLAQRTHALTPTGQNFVRIGLVAHIPHHTVLRRVEDIVQRDGELDRAKVGAEVPSRPGHTAQQKSPQLCGKLAQLATGQPPKIGGVINGLQQGVGRVRHMLRF